MNPIKLTKKQEYKLLEMLESLFPENKFEFDNVYECKGLGILSIDEMTANFKEIHWFEFCIKQLIPKMLINNDIQPIIDMRILFCELPNPIDYLYNHFKKLKL